IIERQLAIVSNSPKGDRGFGLGDGRVVVARFGPDSLRVVAISADGDTVFKRGLPPAKTIFSVVGGPDGTIWVSTGSLASYATHTAFDQKGEIIGTLDLDGRTRVAA